MEYKYNLNEEEIVHKLGRPITNRERTLIQYCDSVDNAVMTIRNIEIDDENYSHFMSQVGKERVRSKYFCKNEKSTVTMTGMVEDEYE